MNRNQRETINGIQVAFEVVGIIFGSMMFGLLLDQWTGLEPLFVLIFSFAGIVGAFTKLLMLGVKKK